MAPGVGRHEHRAARTSSGRANRAASSNCDGQLEVPRELGAEHVRPPLVVRDRQRRRPRRRPTTGAPAQHAGLPSPPPSRNASTTRRSVSTGWLTVIKPSAHPDDARRLLRHRGAEQRAAASAGRLHSSPDPRGRARRDRDLLAAQQRADHLDAFEQARVRAGLSASDRPSRARSAPRRSRARPRTAREQLAERRDRLRDAPPGGTAVPGAVTTPNRRTGRLQRGAEPGPRVAGVPLALAPRSEMVRTHRRVEPRRLGADRRRRAARAGTAARVTHGTRRRHQPDARPDGSCERDGLTSPSPTRRGRDANRG